MLEAFYNRIKNGFAIMLQAFQLMHQHKTFYWLALLLMGSYAAILSALSSCFFYFITSTVWHRVTTGTNNIAYEGTIDPTLFMRILGMLLITLFIHALWKNILEITVSTYAAAAMHNDYAQLSVGRAFIRTFSALWYIVCWVLLNITIGFVISAVSGGNPNEKNFSIIDWLRQMLGSMLSMAWSICTFLVPQVIAFEGTGAINSIKISFNLIKQTFGESLSANFIFSAFYSAIGLMVGLCAFLCSLFIVPSPTGSLHFPLIPSVLFVLVLLGAAFTIAAITVARMIFKTSIYFYAKNKECIGFDASLISQSFR
ncbi:hypothetical protein FJ365_01340 [Candidatus Dependentiae bacterium]|nr:hypothetical protein [Candidatus Dependentiae bacterium]